MQRALTVRPTTATTACPATRRGAARHPTSPRRCRRRLRRHTRRRTRAHTTTKIRGTLPNRGRSSAAEAVAAAAAARCGRSSSSAKPSRRTRTTAGGGARPRRRAGGLACSGRIGPSPGRPSHAGVPGRPVLASQMWDFSCSGNEKGVTLKPPVTSTTAASRTWQGIAAPFGFVDLPFFYYSCG
ncbi:hypothetical protein F4802DRAFT_586304 [Xylaria palmicola]|nr:hypothetical protein F4802DRAFT_586304 [Xylaria palmicola]